MLILLPPSEGKAAPPRRGRVVDPQALSFPELTAQRLAVLDRLAAVSARDDALAVLGVGASLAAEVERNTRLRRVPVRPASALYTGVLYAALDWDSLPPGAKRRAASRLIVISALWGALRPGDAVPSYRLSMSVPLPGIGPLHSDGDGQSHNIYCGRIKSLTMRSNYIHHARVGHNIESRAARNLILYNRIADESDGNASYAIDLPNGGISIVLGNIVQKGPLAENRTLISYGAEGYGQADNSLYVVNNTLIDEKPGAGRFIFVRDGATSVSVINNLYAGAGNLLVGAGFAKAISRQTAAISVT